ncbi:hypothetical protein ACJX0J_027521, partial [Zea mays]
IFRIQVRAMYWFTALQQNIGVYRMNSLTTLDIKLNDLSVNPNPCTIKTTHIIIAGNQSVAIRATNHV